MHLSTESVKGLALALERVHDVEGRDGLAAGVLGVRDGVLDDVLKEGLENTTGLLVHHTGDALHATTTSDAADRGLCDALDVITHDFADTLGLLALHTGLSTARHVKENVGDQTMRSN